MGIIYDETGAQIGRVSGDFFYDGDGRQIGRASGDFLYDESGRQIGRWDGVRRRDVICFFYFYVRSLDGPSSRPRSRGRPRARIPPSPRRSARPA